VLLTKTFVARGDSGSGRRSHDRCVRTDHGASRRLCCGRLQTDRRHLQPADLVATYHFAHRNVRNALLEPHDRSFYDRMASELGTDKEDSRIAACLGTGTDDDVADGGGDLACGAPQLCVGPSAVAARDRAR
jgi:hypothetical protein